MQQRGIWGAVYIQLCSLSEDRVGGLCRNSLVGFIEYRAAIHMLAVRLRHGPGSGLWAEEALIALLLQLHQKEVVVLLCFNFLLTEPKMHQMGLHMGLLSTFQQHYY